MKSDLPSAVYVQQKLQKHIVCVSAAFCLSKGLSFGINRQQIDGCVG